MKTLYNLSIAVTVLIFISSCTKTNMQSSPVNAENNSNTLTLRSVVYIGTKTGFYCINAITGKTKWHFSPGPGYQQVCSSTPIMQNGDVIFNLGDSLYALDMLSGEKKWASYCRHFRSALYTYGYRLYFGTPYGIACYNVDNGQPIWFHKYSVVEAKQNHNSSPIVINEVVYVGGASDNNLYALNASTGDVIWEKNITVFGAYSSPTWYNNQVYMLGDSSLFVFNASNGNLLFQKKFNFRFSYQCPTAFNNKLYVAADSFYCFNPDNGDRVWAFGDTSSMHSSCTTDGFIDNMAVYAVFGNKFYKLDPYTGAQFSGWGNTMESLSDDMIVSEGELLYRGSTSGTLFANNSDNDTPLWSKQFAGISDGGSPITLNNDGSIILPMISGNRY
jgi:outer membrane protein assembly factor BamB